MDERREVGRKSDKEKEGQHQREIRWGRGFDNKVDNKSEKLIESEKKMEKEVRWKEQKEKRKKYK